MGNLDICTAAMGNSVFAHAAGTNYYTCLRNLQMLPHAAGTNYYDVFAQSPDASKISCL